MLFVAYRLPVLLICTAASNVTFDVTSILQWSENIYNLFNLQFTLSNQNVRIRQYSTYKDLLFYDL